MSSAQPLLTVEEVQKIAHLARLKIDSGQAAAHAESLSEILGLMQILQATDTTGIEPLYSPHHRSTPLRADTPDAAIDRDHNQQCAPATEDGLYLVPRVLE